MPLNAGAKLGPYEIVASRGSGGMGEVYRARDPKLNRDVAIKILPEALAADPAAQARFQREAQAVAALSHPNILGYMSPEQVRGRDVDHRTDIFSFGAILYELLAGHRAFTGDSAVETMNAILEDEPAELTRANAALPPALDRIVRRCLEKDPDERFQSARDAFALDAVSGAGGSAVGTVAASAPGSPMRRPPLALAVAAAVVFSLGAFGGVWLMGRFRGSSVPEGDVTRRAGAPSRCGSAMERNCSIPRSTVC